MTGSLSMNRNMPSVTIDGEKYLIPIEVAALFQSVSEERDELKAQLEDCTAVNAEVMKKVARLEKSINNQETDSN